MKALLKVMLVLALFFASTFILIKSTGIITIDKIEVWLSAAKTVAPVNIAIIVIGLLFLDLFIAVPTLTVIILTGYFLGPYYGASIAIVGLTLAGICGYGLSRKYGDSLFRLLIKQSSKRQEATQQFLTHGPVIILLSRATPILPEVSACMAGMTNMHFLTFLRLWLTSTIPYACIGAYAGSISSIDNPKPAIYAAIGLTTTLWIGWMIFKRIGNTNRYKPSSLKTKS